MPLWRDIAHGVAEAVHNAAKRPADGGFTPDFPGPSWARDAALWASQRVEKATRSVGFAPPPPSTMGMMQGQLNETDAPRSAFLNYLDGGTVGPWREHPLLAGNSSFARIRAAERAMPILGVIIKTRADQLAQFAHPAETRYDMGYQVLLRDKGTIPSKRTKSDTSAITKFIFNCGVDTPGSVVRDDFPTYMRKVSEDSLRFAQDATEKVLDRRGLPAQWYAVDSSTIRFAARTSPVWSDDIDNEIRYVQIMNGVVTTAYRYCDMMFGIRNASTDIRMNGYGVSEIETISKALSALIYAFEWNMRFFVQGTSAKGIINMKGEGVTQRMISEFRAVWKTMVSGTDNAHSIPVISADNFDYTDLSKTNKDIEYQQYLDFLIKIIAAAYQMSPDEINFQYGNSGQQNSLAGQDNRQKIVESRVRGLRPHLQLREHLINTQLIWPRWPQYKLAFTGLDAMTRQEAVEFNTKLVNTTHTVDEVRAMDGLNPLPDGLGGNLLNPTYAQFKMAQNAPQMYGQDPNAMVPQDGPHSGADAYDDQANDANSADVDNEDQNNDVDGEIVNKSWEL